MSYKIAINGVLRDMTPEEETDYEEHKTKAIAEGEAIKQAREDFKTLKASAKAKLIAGEALTEDEANTIVL